MSTMQAASATHLLIACLIALSGVRTSCKQPLPLWTCPPPSARQQLAGLPAQLAQLRTLQLALLPASLLAALAGALGTGLMVSSSAHPCSPLHPCRLAELTFLPATEPSRGSACPSACPHAGSWPPGHLLCLHLAPPVSLRTPSLQAPNTLPNANLDCCLSGFPLQLQENSGPAMHQGVPRVPRAPLSCPQA